MKQYIFGTLKNLKKPGVKLHKSNLQLNIA